MRTRSRAPVTPEQQTQAAAPKLHKKFDDQEDDEDGPATAPLVFEVEAPKPKRNARKPKPVEEENDDEAPEQVQISAEEVERLKAEHEQLTVEEPAKKPKRKRKLADQPRAHEELDLSVLEAVAKQQEAQQETDEEDKDDDEEGDESKSMKRIVVHSKGKKLNTHKKFEKQAYNIQVKVLGRDKGSAVPVKAVESAARNFVDGAFSSVKRKQYPAFAAAKRARPAKVFASRRR